MNYVEVPMAPNQKKLPTMDRLQTGTPVGLGGPNPVYLTDGPHIAEVREFIRDFMRGRCMLLARYAYLLLPYRVLRDHQGWTAYLPSVVDAVHFKLRFADYLDNPAT